MVDVEARLRLRTAPDEDAILTRRTQDELVAAHRKVRAAGIPISARHMVFDSVSGGGGLTGDFIIPAAQIVAPVVTAIVVAWLQGRADRQARLKVGDVEAEARSVDKVAKLFDIAKRYQNNSLPPADDQDEPPHE